jgi:hypothetical protein
VTTGHPARKGVWQPWDQPVGERLIQIENIDPQEPLFTQDRRFIFDVVADAASQGATIWIAGSFGTISYEAAPLLKQVSWNRFNLQGVSGVSLFDNQLHALSGNQSYHYNGTTWDAEADAAELYWPLGVRLDATGWRSERLEKNSLAVTGLETSVSLFNSQGKFLFDSVRGVAALSNEVYIYTEAGWIEVSNNSLGTGFNQFIIKDFQNKRLDFNVARIYSKNTNQLILESTYPSPVRYSWIIQNGRISAPTVDTLSTPEKIELDESSFKLGV